MVSAIRSFASVVALTAALALPGTPGVARSPSPAPLLAGNTERPLTNTELAAVQAASAGVAAPRVVVVALPDGDRGVFTVADGRRTPFGTLSAGPAGAYLVPVTQDAVAAADELGSGALIAVSGWLGLLGWGLPCPAPPPGLPGPSVDSPFVRCPGGWITPTSAVPAGAPGQVALQPDGFGIPVQASAYATFAPDPATPVDGATTPREAVYLLLRVPNPIPQAEPAAGWQVIGRLDPVETFTRAGGPSFSGSLDWSAPMPGPDGLVRDVEVAVDGALVAVGQVQEGRGVRAAAWRSMDGTAWERTLAAGPRTGASTLGLVARRADGGLVAFGNQGLMRCSGRGEGGVVCRRQPVVAYRSVDGRSWERIEPEGGLGTGAVTGLAAGPLGWLAVGVDGRGRPTIRRSADGLAWEVDRMAGEGATGPRPAGVAATGDGWVIVGWTGGTEVGRGGARLPDGSRGAAWTSQDGVVWRPAGVGGKGPDVELRSVFAGAGGLTAVGTLTGGNEAAAWTSSDGTDWMIVPQGPHGWVDPLPAASDGRSIVGWSAADDPETGVITWSVSPDGVAWTPLDATGAVATLPRWEGGTWPELAVLADGRLLVVGEGDATPNVLWVARPVAAPPANPPEAVLDRSLRMLSAGDCAAAAAFVASPFGHGNGDLCGAAALRSFGTLDLADVADPSVENPSLEDGPTR